MRDTFAYFCCRKVVRITFASIKLFYYTFNIWINNKWCLSDFWYWLNSNILVSSEGIITLQKNLLSHTFLCSSSLPFVVKDNLNNKSHHYYLLMLFFLITLVIFFTVRWWNFRPLRLAWYPFLSGIIKRINRILWYELFWNISRIYLFLFEHRKPSKQFLYYFS